MKLKEKDNYYWIEGFKEHSLYKEDIIFALEKSKIRKAPVSVFLPLRTSTNPSLKNVRAKEIREKLIIVTEFCKIFPEYLV